jgi:hypothetical protein
VPLAQNRAAIPWVGPRTKILTPPKAQRRGHSTDDLRSWTPGVGAEANRPARQRMAEPPGRIRLTVCPADSSPDDLSRPLPSVWPAHRAPQPHRDRRNPESCRHRAMPPLLSGCLQRRAAPVNFIPPEGTFLGGPRLCRRLAPRSRSPARRDFSFSESRVRSGLDDLPESGTGR